MPTIPLTPGGIGPIHSRVRPPSRARSRRSILARRETYTRLLSAIIMLGVVMTWVWIFGIAAQRRAQQHIESQIGPAPSSGESDATALNASPPAPPLVVAAVTRDAAPASVERSVTPSGQLPAPVTLAELTVTSEPAGARVTVDGIGWGVTPVTIRHLSFGSKRVRLTMDGLAPAERVVHLTDRRPRQSLHITLRHLTPTTPELHHLSAVLCLLEARR